MGLGIVEAVLLGQKREAEKLTGAVMPDRWPNPELVERAFAMTLDAVRASPEARLWGARVLVARAGGQRRVVGSLVYKGAPNEAGIVEIAYGIEESSQGQGFATEGVGASIAWALAEGGARAVHASTFAWHRASVRVLEKVGMTPVDVREHDTMGEMLVYGVSR